MAHPYGDVSPLARDCAGTPPAHQPLSPVPPPVGPPGPHPVLARFPPALLPRHPGQQLFLRSWLARRRSESDALLSCLDAACGSGEGSWDLATLCSECGYLPHQVTIHGSSLDPLELFAAAHAFFPHDSQREEEYRKRIAPVIKGGFGERLRFILEDLADSRSQPERYDLILCNGLLGGPMLHDPLRLSAVVRGLVRRLKAGGLFLAADRFHEGWQKRIPQQEREALLEQCGVKIVPVGEGIGGSKR